MSEDHIVWVWVHTQSWDNEIAWLRSPDVCSLSVISDVRGPYCLGVCTHTVLGRWNCLTDITWCLFMKCDQWCQRTILSGCEYTYSLGTMKLPDWHHLMFVHEVCDQWCQTGNFTGTKCTGTWHMHCSTLNCFPHLGHIKHFATKSFTLDTSPPATTPTTTETLIKE